jgi:glycosyltransferase involved in cell wall biosynthesis
MFQTDKATFHDSVPVDVTIVMPCLNEAQSLPHCIRNAHEALKRVAARYGLQGEIVIADNGSTDGSQVIATAHGARVISVSERGYGAALIGGCQAALGSYILMGDCDGSYDFTDGVPMIGRLLEGHALCMGSRFDGGIAPGAMPWKNRYIGNPVLTGILNLFFRAGINDAHCGLRAIRKESFLRLNLSGTGMEFASEMVIKAALLRLPIAQVPATLSPDLRQRAPHLRPWRDGWRHLRYLMMLAPNWLFGGPGLLALLTGLIILIAAGLQYLRPGSFPWLGDYWTILGCALINTGHLLLMLTCASQIYSLRERLRRPGLISRLASRFASLETMLIGGLGLVTSGMATFVIVYLQWVERHYQATDGIFLPMFSTLCLTLGTQTIFGGFLMAIIGGHRAEFIPKQALLSPIGEPIAHSALL